MHDARLLGKLADVTLFVVRQDLVSLSEITTQSICLTNGNSIDGLSSMASCRQECATVTDTHIIINKGSIENTENMLVIMEDM